MRTWLAEPRKMCQQHRLGEHAEAHMFVGTMAKGISLQGYYANHLFFGRTVLLERHLILSETFENHASPLVFPTLTRVKWSFYPDIPVTQRLIDESVQELTRRCHDCRILHLITPGD